VFLGRVGDVLMAGRSSSGAVHFIFSSVRPHIFSGVHLVVVGLLASCVGHNCSRTLISADRFLLSIRSCNHSFPPLFSHFWTGDPYYQIANPFNKLFSQVPLSPYMI
jgi:hypothetical protein